MGIEILLGVLVFPVAQKLGEKWIDRIATGIDENLVSLFKAAINDPKKRQDVTDRLRSNPELELAPIGQGRREGLPSQR